MARDKQKGKRKISPEPELEEDWCFYCKDGGQLVFCDHKNCGKVYHPNCVKKDESFFKNAKSWSCGWHVCYNCNKRPKFNCISCPNAVCTKCFPTLKFTLVRGVKGLCVDCSEVVTMIEQNLEHDSEGNKISFDGDSYEALFKPYWENVIKVKEGLTSDELSTALAMPNNSKGKNAVLVTSCCESNEDSRDKQTRTKQKRYKKKNLDDPKDKAKFLPDENLVPLLGEEAVSKDKMRDCLESHIAKGFPNSAGDQSYNEDKNGSLYKHIDDLTCLESKLSGSKEKPELKKGELARKTKLSKPTGFASIVDKNLMLIYLKQSLVIELSQKEPESFANKVVGTFVRAKVLDSNDTKRRRKFYQLVRVLGVVTDEISDERLLQVSATPELISISELSDDYFKVQECEELRQKVETSLLPKLTVEEVQEKAEILHEDVTRHWIPWRIKYLNLLLENANCSGRMNQKEVLLQEREELKRPAKVEELLRRVPSVTREFIEVTNDDSDEEN